jgi:hypothetical protein
MVVGVAAGAGAEQAANINTASVDRTIQKWCGLMLFELILRIANLGGSLAFV